MIATQIARVVHEANRALQIEQADPSIPVSPSWDDTDEETQRSAVEAENNRRLGASRTHCKNNHRYTTATTWKRKNGARGCRVCRNASSSASRKRKKELAGV
jgi:hypothetical protein